MQFVGQNILKTLLKTAASSSLTCSRPASSLVRRTMQAHKIVPDVVPDAPVLLATVSYFNTNVTMGKKVTPQVTKAVPCVKWPHEKDRLYCMIMLDPDSPSHCQNYDAEWHHWLVGNIPGDNHAKGEIIYSYIGPVPELHTGIHRYVFLIFEQPSRICFTEPRLSNNSIFGRTKQNFAQIACKYNLGIPVAGNFFLAEWDCYVPHIQTQMNISFMGPRAPTTPQRFL